MKQIVVFLSIAATVYLGLFFSQLQPKSNNQCSASYTTLLLLNDVWQCHKQSLGLYSQVYVISHNDSNLTETPSETSYSINTILQKNISSKIVKVLDNFGHLKTTIIRQIKTGYQYNTFEFLGVFTNETEFTKLLMAETVLEFMNNRIIYFTISSTNHSDDKCSHREILHGRILCKIVINQMLISKAIIYSIELAQRNLKQNTPDINIDNAQGSYEETGEDAINEIPIDQYEDQEEELSDYDLDDFFDVPEDHYRHVEELQEETQEEPQVKFQEYDAGEREQVVPEIQIESLQSSPVVDESYMVQGEEIRKIIQPTVDSPPPIQPIESNIDSQQTKDSQNSFSQASSSRNQTTQNILSDPQQDLIASVNEANIYFNTETVSTSAIVSDQSLNLNDSQVLSNKQINNIEAIVDPQSAQSTLLKKEDIQTFREVIKLELDAHLNQSESTESQKKKCQDKQNETNKYTELQSKQMIVQSFSMDQSNNSQLIQPENQAQTSSKASKEATSVADNIFFGISQISKQPQFLNETQTNSTVTPQTNSTVTQHTNSQYYFEIIEFQSTIGKVEQKQPIKPQPIALHNQPNQQNSTQHHKNIEQTQEYIEDQRQEQIEQFISDQSQYEPIFDNQL